MEGIPKFYTIVYCIDKFMHFKQKVSLLMKYCNAAIVRTNFLKSYFPKFCDK